MNSKMEKTDFNNAEIYSKLTDTCPLCSSLHIKQLYIIDTYQPAFKIDICEECGFIFMNPLFNENVIKNFYLEEYYTGKSEYSYYDEREAKKYAMYVWNKRIDVIHRYIKSGNFLDIGSAFGGLLEAAKKYFIPYGIEMSLYAGNYAKSLFGNYIHIGTLKDHPFQNDFFSAITMIEVIEHLADPIATLQECYRLLEKNGILVIQTANMDGYQAKILKDSYAYFMPGHLSYFTKKNLTELLKNIGFNKIKIFLPVEFGLLPKLQKSRYTFKSIWDYRNWVRITFYHYLSKIHFKNFAMTSSMVIYAFK